MLACSMGLRCGAFRCAHGVEGRSRGSRTLDSSEIGTSTKRWSLRTRGEMSLQFQLEIVRYCTVYSYTLFSVKLSRNQVVAG